MSLRDTKFAYGDKSFPPGAPRLIRGAVLSAYSDAARNAGIDPYAMLRRVGLPPGAIDDPDLRIPADRVRTLIELTAKAAQSDAFGLMVGQAFSLSMKGALGLLAREQATFRAAIEVLASYLKYQNDVIELRLEPGETTLTVKPHVLLGEALDDAQFHDFVMAMHVQVVRGLLGGDWRPRQVRLTRPAPQDTAAYRSLFGDVRFSREDDAILIDNADIDIVIPSANPQMARELSRYVEQSGAPYGSETSMAESVLDLITRLLPTGDCSIDRVAQHLGIDRRTVHRRLVAQGASFSELVERARRAVVTARLGQSDQPLGAVAHLLGFASQSTFSRWFRQTYGMPPSEFRGALRH